MLEYTVGRIGSSSSLNLFAEPPKLLLSFYHYCYDNHHHHSLPKPRSSFTPQPQPQPHLSSHFHYSFPSNCKWPLLTFLNIHFLSTILYLPAFCILFLNQQKQAALLPLMLQQDRPSFSRSPGAAGDADKPQMDPPFDSSIILSHPSSTPTSKVGSASSSCFCSSTFWTHITVLYY